MFIRLRITVRRHTFTLLLLALAQALLVVWASPAQAKPQTCQPVWPCTDARGCPDFYIAAPALASKPDLVFQQFIFSDTDCAFVRGMVSGTGLRLLLSFRTRIGNLGPGAFQIGSPLDNPDLFNTDDCHGHAHIKDFVAYRLWTPSGYQRWTALRAANPNLCADDVLAANPDLASEVIDGGKHGFCLTDFREIGMRRDGMHCPVKKADPQVYVDCTFQGLGVCWTETYPPGVIGQWIDVTGIADGEYVLENEVNPKRTFLEASYENDDTAIVIQITGLNVEPLQTLAQP